MPTRTLKGRSARTLDRLKTVDARQRAVRDWSDGKVSSAQRDKAIAVANDKLRSP